MKPLIIAAVFIILPMPPQPSEADVWAADVAAAGGLTRQLVAKYRDMHDPAALVARFFPAQAVADALMVMNCESGGDPTAKNRDSTAAGLFQFLRGTWNDVAGEMGLPAYRTGAPYVPRFAVAAAARLYERAGGWGPWSCKP